MRIILAPWQCLAKQALSQGKGSADPPQRVPCHPSPRAAAAWVYSCRKRVHRKFFQHRHSAVVESPFPRDFSAM